MRNLPATLNGLLSAVCLVGLACSTAFGQQRQFAPRSTPFRQASQRSVVDPYARQNGYAPTAPENAYSPLAPYPDPLTSAAGPFNPGPNPTFPQSGRWQRNPTFVPPITDAGVGVGVGDPNVVTFDSECTNCPTGWQLLPEGLMYKSYLAGVREPRFGSAWLYKRGQGWIWDVTLGGRVGLLRKGTYGVEPPSGWQIDLEGAAFPRFNIENHNSLQSLDFRVGVPVTWASGPWEFKMAYTHLESHLGDDYLRQNPGTLPNGYVRDSIVFGYGYFLTEDLRFYVETDLAFHKQGGAKTRHYQFGAEYSPIESAGDIGLPFLAVNVQLREETDFSGAVNVIGGWQWRGANSGRLLRGGFQYYSGKSSQFSFFNTTEELFGIGLWYDY